MTSDLNKGALESQPKQRLGTMANNHRCQLLRIYQLVSIPLEAADVTPVGHITTHRILSKIFGQY